MKKLLFIFGTRPEAIKMLPIVLYAKKNMQDVFSVHICITGQHREMLNQVLDFFEVKPDYDLSIMQPGQDLYDVTIKILQGLKTVIQEIQPDCILVHGDTTTTMSASIAAYYQRIPVAHVEAGLRTFNKYSPWPEELNRTITGCIAKYHFAPTVKSLENLNKENITEHILVAGNSVIDALLFAVNKLNTDVVLSKKLTDRFNELKIDLDKRIVLITGHRRENFGDGFINICEAIHQLAINYPEVEFVYPVHLNPNVQTPVYKLLGNSPNIKLIEPLDYQPFVFLMSKAYIILTDSGGVQEEAPSLHKPVLVMRDTTERPEAIATGAVKLVGTDKAKIIEEVALLLNDREVYTKMTKTVNPYGDGTTSKKILDYLKENLHKL
jgi:UDP-N-acetylglucosamine 2-epimerase (non-hydrolysing)